MTNSGDAPVDGVVVGDSLAENPELTNDTYSASGTGGAAGSRAARAGFRDIDDTVDLPAGSTITYLVVAELNYEECVLGLSNTAVLTPPAGVVLGAGSNLTATDSDSGFVGAC